MTLMEEDFHRVEAEFAVLQRSYIRQLEALITMQSTIVEQAKNMDVLTGIVTQQVEMLKKFVTMPVSDFKLETYG